jgi:hypothetical protein
MPKPGGSVSVSHDAVIEAATNVSHIPSDIGRTMIGIRPPSTEEMQWLDAFGFS